LSMPYLDALLYTSASLSILGTSLLFVDSW